MKQNELIKLMSDEELKRQLMLSQLIFLLLGIFLSIFFFESMEEWLYYLDWKPAEIILYGVLPGFLIVLIDMILILLVPEKYYDDGGINERIFRNQSIGYIFVISLLVAVSEEILFRGVIQTNFGYIVASILFALVHFRYLKKPFLLVSILFVSFYIGYLFEITENILVTITAHFIVDFLLGLIIRFKK
ncbi:CPBP family intramembrane metalloprotease [Virgibacillus sp. C22-A2]|uniref:CPBP family intramembrane metalloprotease n=1 Tax=Virgibacillus tibetensis TaxID=3042313 RepID=A0ABU6KDA4_9BACI|nr:CPBP family intramembrane metalloprotease [Virgibacillus sp. C22-A2]